jgi:DNA adenine methylase
MMTKANRGRLSALLKCHGGKSYLADRIIALMPRHLVYVEPFFGGGQVFFRRDPRDPRLWWDGPTSDGRKADGVCEIINDIDGDLMNLYAVLKDPGTFPELQHRLDLTLFAEKEYRDACRLLAGPGGNPVDRAAALFVLVRQSMAGRRTEFTPITQTRLRGGRNGEVNAWWNAIEGLAAVHERLRDVVVLCRPALEVIRQHDSAAALFYLDPPYVPETRTSAEVYGRFEMTLGDHRELLDTIRGCRAKFILSGYDNGLYNTVLSDWTRREYGLPNNAAGGTKKRRMTEVLWCNF